MQYQDIRGAVFVDRPNRFVAHVDMGGTLVTCHVKNTGRCKELLTPGARVLLEKSQNPQRKTAYDLVAVYKGERLVNMDAVAPNAAFGEWVRAGGYVPAPSLVRPETVHGDSRFDFYIEAGDRRIFAEVKGVTLERDNGTYFPDAPTLRGAKHLRGLAECVKEGYEAVCVFVIQMEGVDFFSPNEETDPQFARALRAAHAAGVRILALDCRVREDGMEIGKEIPVRL